MEIRIAVWDIETLYEMGLFGFYLPVEDQWYIFEFSERKVDLYPLLKFCERLRKEEYYLVGYNSVRFDAQVLEYILRKSENWYDKSGPEISRRIWRFAQDVIHDMNYDLFPPYREEQLTHKHIDLLKIHHFDNKNRRTSLKWLEFMMDLPNIEEMPIHHAAFIEENGRKVPMYREFTEEDFESIISYWRNDIHATLKWYQYTIGEVEHSEYKGKNKVLDRLNLIKELGLSHVVMNYSDVKIGDELNKLGYCKLTNTDPKKLYDLKKNRKPTRKFTFGDCIPEYVKFETKELQDFYNRVKNIKVSLQKDDQEFPLDFYGTRYTIAKGGIHSNEKHRILIPKDNEILRDADVGSQYPNAIVKRRLYPSHLGPEWLVNYEAMIETRFKYKAFSKEETERGRAAKGIEGMYKLALNGGGFGKTNERESWQYDPTVTFYCTIGNQFEILMLVEKLELNGIHVVSANTDGIVCLFDKEKEKTYQEICTWWEQTVGNVKMGKLEFTDFKALYQESVNCYVAIKTDGKAKVKGRFAYEVELNKNNTKDLGRIERKAIVEYFKNGTPVEKTIKECKNIYDFCYGMKSSKDYHYETISNNESFDESEDSDEGNTFQRIIRFFFILEGKRILKIKNATSEAPGASITKIARGKSASIFNSMVMVVDWSQIDYTHYIENAQKVIDKIERKTKENKNQLKLF